MSADDSHWFKMQQIKKNNSRQTAESEKAFTAVCWVPCVFVYVRERACDQLLADWTLVIHLHC